VILLNIFVKVLVKDQVYSIGNSRGGSFINPPGQCLVGTDMGDKIDSTNGKAPCKVQFIYRKGISNCV
jgi:hypothetical protein